jgi:hypothetical protein
MKLAFAKVFIAWVVVIGMLDSTRVSNWRHKGTTLRRAGRQSLAIRIPGCPGVSKLELVVLGFGDPR